MSGGYQSARVACSLPPEVQRNFVRTSAPRRVSMEYPAWLAALLANSPFDGRATLQQFSLNAVGEFTFAVAVPVRNEGEILPQMLAALLSAITGIGERGLAVFAVNDTQDASAQLIRNWLALNELSGVVIEVGFAPAIRSAPYTRRLALDVASRFAPAGALLTTDADSEVGPGWVRQGLDGLADGFDLICEDVRLDDVGLAALPDQVRLAGDAERAYYAACDVLWRRWSGETGAFAHRASGASLAIAAATYRKLGRLPVPHHGEDAALCAMVLADGGRVITIADGGTRTSARLEGRAAGGCGAALSRRASEIDPVCDAALVPLAELRRLASFRVRHGYRAERDRPERALRYSEILVHLAHARALLAEEAIV